MRQKWFLGFLKGVLLKKRNSCKGCTETLMTLRYTELQVKADDAEEYAQLQSLTGTQRRKKLQKKGGTW